MSRFLLCVLVLASIALSCGEESKQDLVVRADVGVELARDVREAEAKRGRNPARRQRPKKEKKNIKWMKMQGKKPGKTGKKPSNGKPNKPSARKGKGGKVNGRNVNGGRVNGGKGKGGKTRRKGGKKWPRRKGNRGNNSKTKGERKKTRNNKKKDVQNIVPKITPRQGEECPAQIANAQKLKNKGVNYKKQFDRMNKFKEIGDTKGAMAGDFPIISTQLSDVGGGNKSALECSGDASGSGAASLKTAVDTLDLCESSITTACNTSAYPLPSDLDVVQECNDNFKALIESVKKCEAPTAVLCECYADIPAAELEKAQSCKVISDDMKAVKKAHGECTKAFKACNKEKKNSGPLFYACAQTVAALQTKAVQAQANSVAIAAANAAVTKVSSSRRRARAAPTTCAELITASNELAALATDSPTSKDVETKAAEITEAASSITCTDAEKTELSGAADALTAAATELSKVVTALAAAIGESTGTVPEVETLTAPPVVTPAAAARRNRLVRNILAGLNN